MGVKQLSYEPLSASFGSTELSVFNTENPLDLLNLDAMPTILGLQIACMISLEKTVQHLEWLAILLEIMSNLGYLAARHDRLMN